MHRQEKQIFADKEDLKMFDFYIVTAVLNAVDTIDRTVWSILSQRGDVHIHYHVQDAGSTDGTLEKLEAWQRRLTSCSVLPAKISFSLASEPDSGLYEGIQRGFERLEIPEKAFMAYLNSDDVLFPGAVQTVAQVARDLPDVDWLYGWRGLMDQWGRIVHTNVLDVDFPRSLIAEGLAESIHHHHIMQETTVWRKRLYDKAGGLDTTRFAGDWDLWRRFAKHSEMVHLRANIGAFCRRPGQLSGDLGRYTADIDKAIPRDVRKSKMMDIIKNKDSLAITVSDLDTDGRWKLRLKKEIRFRSEVIKSLAPSGAEPSVSLTPFELPWWRRLIKNPRRCSFW